MGNKTGILCHRKGEGGGGTGGGASTTRATKRSKKKTGVEKKKKHLPSGILESMEVFPDRQHEIEVSETNENRPKQTTFLERLRQKKNVTIYSVGRKTKTIWQKRSQQIHNPPKGKGYSHKGDECNQTYQQGKTVKFTKGRVFLSI